MSDLDEFASCRRCGEEHPAGVLDDDLCPTCVDLEDDEDDELSAVRSSGGLLP
jgi:hypothetical protein